ncbi:MAG: antibiotic biosynthesis monooxygenase [Alphaproteobacteria bacterium]|nr:antibiotic biosynthesis monooxygenase [Alphaproteobacteria bacterium]
MDIPIIAFAKLTPKPEFYELVKDALLEIIPKALKNPGCQRLNLYEAKDEGMVYIYEAWENETAYDYHLAQDYTKEALTNLQTWLATPIEVIELSQLI